MSCIIMFSAMVVVYCGSIALPSLLQALFGYDALASGLVMSPSGVSSFGRDGGHRHPAGPAG